TIFASHQPIPFDVNFLRSVPYDIGPNNGFGTKQAEALRTNITNWLIKLRENARQSVPIDSPVFELLGDWRPGDIARLKTDTFRDRVQFNAALKSEIAQARLSKIDVGKSLLDEIQDRIEFDGVEAGVLIDLFLSRRALSDWDGMIDLYDRFPEVLKRQVLAREQLAFALNRRAGRDDNEPDRKHAVEILQSVVDDQGPSSETCGLLGRIHKDRWTLSKDNDPIAARGHLNLAIEAYVRGFQADWRDAYPGVNAVTLLDIDGRKAALARKAEILPVVKYAVAQRITTATPDYWDHATLLELEVLNNQPDEAIEHLSSALALVRESWEPESTANNLGLIKEARQSRGDETGWIDRVIQELMNKAG
ncbi:MAG: DUF4071 domain-containing protein, partial [Rhodobacteraceae bacterium]|nr:DUF4071 domain-containing protein [Paracoccaceae bacterium]